MSDQPLPGRLFSRNYLIPDKKASDSKRARTRFGALLSESPLGDKFANLVTRELGVRYPYGYGWNHTKFFDECELRDFLDAITLFIQLTKAEGRSSILPQATRILAEEHLRYALDSEGGVHYLVDEVFERSVITTLQGLGETRFGAALHDLQAALSEFSGPTPSGKALIHKMFQAVESTFLVIANDPSINRISDSNLDKYLKPLLLARYKDYPERADKTDRILKLFGAWIHTAHPFRHGAPLDQVHEAPIDYAVSIADQGMAFIRLMVSK
ncbi:hypothetical protein DK847_09145 [Aestuariivirga litoralis]|uniref:Uncharacterized protein n=1 Tax=Aestuariivirga litoralis TaxID=2650924 RepID=A0A2W2AUS0_9HYPH|nr:hypothetical protein [Aestuariivirga litoralis]PZF77472.1 hypothetical protein DK847_09145 [Aestuariivirga litoralis]